MPKPRKVEVKKLVQIGGSQGVILNPDGLLHMGWTKGSYLWVLYHEDRIELTKHDISTKQKGKK